uniref:Uncharacterized protein n=1 Tax=Panagrolaimus sp. JU765 TaxID=591449 RepID=A0AC34RI61_9BILA
MTPLNGQYLKAPVHEPGLTARMRKAVDTSSSEMENIAPPPRPKVMKRSNSLAHTARHYTVRPQ